VIGPKLDTAELRKRCEWLRFIESTDDILRGLLAEQAA
jgi:hypothetical protein